MTLTKKELIPSVADGCFSPEEGYISHKDKQDSLNKAQRAVEAILSTIEKTLVAGEDVRVVGFGTFGVQAYPERQGRNPRTGLPMTIKSSRRIRFRPGKFLKDAVSGEAKPTHPVKRSPKEKGIVAPKSSLARAKKK